ncbi:DinB family protein [Cohnella zeiphila]|uniref:DinB family protein n=1 Tax=Cohnella zeiphila TaxID=2761120 RepID=A0A7X0ST98_9BACL|nr:DinB family protein [Cohnella zeiphila]MBB6735688.1 DinB family protein [Cohnella zeiphila]
MEAVNEMKKLLFEELEHAARTSAKLIARIDSKDWDYRPRDNMRTLLELARHVVSIPGVDSLIMQEKPEPDIRRREAEIAASGPEADKLNGWLDTGLQELRAYMDGLSDEDFLHRSTKPFYLPHGSVQAKWLIETTTHLFHHRAQLFNYMKALGYEINMFDLY